MKPAPIALLAAAALGLVVLTSGSSSSRSRDPQPSPRPPMPGSGDKPGWLLQPNSVYIIGIAPSERDGFKEAAESEQMFHTLGAALQSVFGMALLKVEPDGSAIHVRTTRACTPTAEEFSTVNGQPPNFSVPGGKR